MIFIPFYYTKNIIAFQYIFRYFLSVMWIWRTAKGGGGNVRKGHKYCDFVKELQKISKISKNRLYLD